MVLIRRSNCNSLSLFWGQEFKDQGQRSHHFCPRVRSGLTYEQNFMASRHTVDLFRGEKRHRKSNIGTQ